MSRFGILTVCTGNLHRSALAAALLARWADWYLPPELAERVDVASAGTAAPVGAPMGELPAAIAVALGADGAAHRARMLSDAAIAEADLVLAASRAHRDEIVSRVPAAMRRTFTIREAARAAQAVGRLQPPVDVDDLRDTVRLMADNRIRPADAGEDDVIDPQRRGPDAYLRMAGEEVPALGEVAAALFGMPASDVAEYRRVSTDPVFLGIPLPDGGDAE